MKITLSIDSKKSIVIGHSDLATIISWLADDSPHASFFAQLFDHPSSEVRSAVAGMSFMQLDELEALSRDSSIEVVRQVANNRRALKMFDSSLILKMISRDVSVAAEIADNLGQIRESEREEIIEVLLKHIDPKVVETTQSFVNSIDDLTWDDDTD